MDDELIVDISLNDRGGSVSDGVYTILKKNILHWRLKPGQRISEKEISDYLDVSRTPVRESFIKLSSESLLDILPQRGTFVSKIHLAEVEEGLFIRRNLETAVLRRAPGELDDTAIASIKQNMELQKQAIHNKNTESFLALDEEFHRHIFYGCGREMTWNVMQNANTQYNRIRMLTLIDIDKFNQILDEHSRILEAFTSGSAEKAVTAGTEHLEHLYIEENVLRKKYPDYFT